MTIRKGEDFGRWYQELVVKSEMIDYSDISGGLVQDATRSALPVFPDHLADP